MGHPAVGALPPGRTRDSSLGSRKGGELSEALTEDVLLRAWKAANKRLEGQNPFPRVTQVIHPDVWDAHLATFGPKQIPVAPRGEGD